MTNAIAAVSLVLAFAVAMVAQPPTPQPYTRAELVHWAVESGASLEEAERWADGELER